MRAPASQQWKLITWIQIMCECESSRSLESRAQSGRKLAANLDFSFVIDQESESSLAGPSGNVRNVLESEKGLVPACLAWGKHLTARNALTLTYLLIEQQNRNMTIYLDWRRLIKHKQKRRNDGTTVIGAPLTKKAISPTSDLYKHSTG